MILYSNTLRGYLNDNLMIVFDVKDFENNVKTVLTLFQVFIILVGFIAF